MNDVPQKPYWLRHSPANGHGVPVHPFDAVASSVGAGVIGAGVTGEDVYGGLVGRSVGLPVSGGGGSLQLVKAKHFWFPGQSSLLEEGHLMAQPVFASAQSLPQK